MTVTGMMAKLRRVKNLGLVVIDYLGLMQSEHRNDNRVQEVSEISRNLKLMAKEFEVPVICCAQLSRGPESRTDKRPMLSDLRDSGAIEQDADIVMFLYREEYYKDKENPIITPRDTAAPEDLSEKDLATLDIVERKVKNGERVLIYTNWVRLDTQEKLKNLLSEKGYITEILRVNIPPDKRETWVEDKVRKGIDVLITNPSLVETGLDLNAFTTLVYYNIGYNLFTFRQSSRRSWRINQTAPRIEVYMLYYKGVMQERALKLMASKLAVATIIEGNLSDEGLAAMSECRDMTTLLAKELTLGIKSEVDDLSEAFKKMAIIHDRTEETQITEADENNVEEVKTDNQEKLKLYIPPVRVHTEVEISVSAAFSSKKRHSKAEYDDPDQISLFDLLAS